MPGPAVQVHVDFTNTDTWVDVSGYVAAGQITRGRQRELDRFQAGRLTLTLRNDDRRFDPSHTTGPYGSDVKPMRRVRVRAVWNAVTYPLFLGYVDRWALQPGGPRDATVRVDATDAFKVLQKTLLPSSVYAAEVLADEPAAWWRLNEPDDEDVVFDSVGEAHLTYYGAPERVQQSLITREPNGSVLFEHTSVNRAEGTGTQVITGYPFTVEGVFSIKAQRDDYQRFLYREKFTAANLVSLEVAATPHAGRLVWSHADGTTGQAFASSGRVDDGNPHHVAVVATAANAVTIYVDGVAASSNVHNTSVPTVPSGAVSVSLGNIGEQTFAAGLFGLDGWLQDVAVYRYAVPGPRILAHATARAAPWAGDIMAERSDRIASIADRTWYGETNALAPTRDFDPGQTSLQSAELGTTALEHLQAVADAEFGVFYVEADGTLRAKERTALINQPVMGTFTDAHGSDPAISVIAPEYGDDLIRNEVTVSRRDGKAQTATDQDSIDDYLTNSYSLNGLIHDSDELSLYAAQFLVSEYGQPFQRLTSVTLRPYGNPTDLFPQVLGRELTDRVLVSWTPQGVGVEVDQESLVEGVEHRFGPAEWETRWALSPAYAGCFLELDAATCGLDTGRIYF